MPAPCPTVAILGTQTRPHAPHSSPLTTHSLSVYPLSASATSPPAQIHPQKKKKNPEGRSPLQPTLPSKKPREGVVPPGTGKPFILGSSLLTDSCVDWKVGCMLYGPGLRQPCGLSVPDLPPLPSFFSSIWAPCTSAHHKFICTNSHPLPPSHPLKPALKHPRYFCLRFGPATYHPCV